MEVALCRTFLQPNQSRFIGLLSSKDYYKRPSGEVCENGHECVWVFKWGHVSRGNRLWKEVGNINSSGNRNDQLASRTVLKDFHDHALTISTGSF